MSAGLGYKLFVTGDVLTAADTNGYLMQGILVFASAAARDAAITSPQEGQCCYLKDTDAVLTYSGAAWVGFDDSNAIQNSIVDAKGDLVAASGADTPARLAVGSNGETLVADSSTATGLRYTGNYASGKNKIINGDFSVNQRNFTSVTTADAYGFDLWRQTFSGGSCTMTPQTFTPGTAPVSGYEGNKYTQIVTASQSAAGDFAIYYIRLEDARILAGQSAVLSFWAKASSGTPIVAAEIAQNFGTGGSPSSAVTTYAGQATLSTSYARYSISVSVPSISGKTFGTNNNSYFAVRVWLSAGSTYNANTGSIGINNNTFSLWGVQVEAGSVATAFQTTTGTIQGELAACQRYYYRSTPTSSYGWLGSGMAQSVSATTIAVNLPVTMRTTPASVDFSTLSLVDSITATAVTSLTIDANVSDNNFGVVTANVTAGLIQYRPYYLRQNANNAGYIGFSAEL